jgi:hypothetical protein
MMTGFCAAGNARGNSCRISRVDATPAPPTAGRLMTRPLEIRRAEAQTSDRGGAGKMPRFAPAVFAACAMGMAALPCPRARADEQMLPLAASGDWVAVEHSDSETSAPDVCLAMTVPGSGKGLAFRAATSDIEVRLNDESWSLPAQVTGSLVFDVGTYHAVRQYKHDGSGGDNVGSASGVDRSNE